MALVIMLVMMMMWSKTKHGRPSDVWIRCAYCPKAYLVGRVARGEDNQGHPQQQQQPQKQQGALQCKSHQDIQWHGVGWGGVGWGGARSEVDVGVCLGVFKQSKASVSCSAIAARQRRLLCRRNPAGVDA